MEVRSGHIDRIEENEIAQNKSKNENLRERE